MKQNLPIIAYITKSSKAIFKELPDILTKQPLNILMPRIYASKHDAFVRNFIENGEPTILNRPFDTFGRTSEDFIFPTKISVKLSPNILKGLQMVSMFTVIKDELDCVCLCNMRNTISDVSESNSPFYSMRLNFKTEFSKLFYLNPRFVKTVGVNITYFSVKLKGIMELMDQFYNPSATDSFSKGPTSSLDRSLQRIPTVSTLRKDASFFQGYDKSVLDVSLNMTQKISPELATPLLSRGHRATQILQSTSIREQEEDSVTGMTLEDEEIRKNFESPQGSLIIFKIPKGFIDSQNKKIMDSQINTRASTNKNLSRVESRGTKKNLEFMGSLAIMLKIKLKLRLLLKKARENMKNASHYIIRARVQIVYLNHKNLSIKVLIIRQIEGSGWEKRRPKVIIRRERVNERPQSSSNSSPFDF